MEAGERGAGSETAAGGAALALLLLPPLLLLLLLLPPMGGGKRSAAGPGFTGAKRHKFSGGPGQPSLPLPGRGFLVSCVAGKEAQACREAAGALKEAYSELREKQGSGAEAPAAAPASDLGTALDADLASLAEKGGSDPAAPPLKTATLGAGLAFLSLPAIPSPGEPTPTSVAIKLARDVAATRSGRSRFVLRVVPFETTVAAEVDAIVAGVKRLVAITFPDTPTTYAVAYDHRASPQSPPRDALVAAVAACAPDGHKVELTAPALTILVHALRGVAGLAVVPDYRALARLNWRELAAPGGTAALAAAAVAGRARAAGEGVEAAGGTEAVEVVAAAAEAAEPEAQPDPEAAPTPAGAVPAPAGEGGEAGG